MLETFMGNIILVDFVIFIAGPKELTSTPLTDVFENKNSGKGVVFAMETPAKKA